MVVKVLPAVCVSKTLCDVNIVCQEPLSVCRKNPQFKDIIYDEDLVVRYN